ncbi:arrestin domain-containing protein 17-like [Mytilus californianus]|uniref:arrestin domain-containing protein 17-like n=1 Tax=Mytilus californianus TaxID=6549 RepID=UPI00224584F4|nr:arrestin domain-containing protein 17-like [Mytilus californianus]
MKLTHFSLTFDVQARVFVAGDRITGKVKVGFGKETKMRCLMLCLEGKGKSFWDVKQGKSTTKYRARENYISQNILLWGGMDGSQMHPAGYATYPFNFPLNSETPSSYEGRRGYVRYTCSAVIDRPWKFNETIKEPFTVIHHLDCSQLLNALNPIYEHRNETIEGCCCEDGSVELDLSINKTAFVPGEPLIYEVMINNQSDNTISEFYLMLRQVATFTGYSDSFFSSGKPHYHTKNENFSMFNQPVRVKKNSTQTYSGASTIPSLPPSILEGCNIINLQYFIILKIPSGWSSLKVEREIIIGTKPARVVQPNAPRIPTANEVAPSQIELSVIPSAPPSYDELPPSYAECVFGAVDIHDEDDGEHTTTHGNWAPAYTYYNWNQQNYSGPQPQAVRPAPPSYNEL